MNYANWTRDINGFTEIDFKFLGVFAKVPSENADTSVSHFDLDVLFTRVYPRPNFFRKHVVMIPVARSQSIETWS